MSTAILATADRSVPIPAGRCDAADDAVQNGGAATDLLDDPLEWAAFSGPSAQDPGWVESNLVIDGITCAACAVTIEQALRATPGVVRADVSAASRRATVVWAPDTVKPSGWMAAIRRLATGHCRPTTPAHAPPVCRRVARPYGAGWWQACA